MNARGFLGTNASLLSDLSLLFGVGVALLLTIGVVMARKRKFEIHRRVQSTAVCLNVLQVALIMVGSFVRSAAPGVPSRLGEMYYAVAAVHGIAGALTVLFGIFVALRANELVPRVLRFHNYKLFMRTTYGAYMIVTVLGVGVYLSWYTGSPTEAQPVSATRANEVVVPMAGFNFNPGVTVVSVGSTVTWINQDNAPHTATADNGAIFSSDLLSNGQKFSFTFDAPGEFKYYCELHGSTGGEGMSGTIKVVTGDQLPAAAAAVASGPVVQPTPVATTFVPDTRTLPRESLVAIQRLLVDGPGLPDKQGYAVGLHDQADELLRHARLLTASQTSGDSAGVRRHAEHIYNLIVGSRDPRFGDLDGDGHSQNAGDGFGLLPNGDQPGYITAMADTAYAAETAPDATRDIKMHAQHVQICANNLMQWATDARALAYSLSQTPDAAAANQLLELASAISIGQDLNGDGQIAPATGEGGGLVAYLHAQYMAGLAPDTGAIAPPAPTSTIVAATARGLLAWRDDIGRSDGALLSVEDLPAAPSDTVYGAWLSGADGDLFLGALNGSPVGGGNTRSLNFAAPDHANLPAEFDTVIVARAPKASVETASPTDAVLMGQLPPRALVYLRQVLAGADDTPGQVAFGIGLRQESDKVLEHAEFLQEAVDESNLANVLFHAEHLVNMIEGKRGEHFGDLSGNGIIENPGDGFGLLENGNQSGYVKGMQDSAQTAAAAPDATESIKVHAGHVVIAGDNTRDRLTQIRDLALQVSKVRRAADARDNVQRILALSHQMIDGVDVNGDEQIAPLPGEGGVLTAYQHAQLMAGIELTSASAPRLVPTAAPTLVPTLVRTVVPTLVAPTAAPTVASLQPARIELAIADDTFTPKTMSVPLGATVVWNRSGTHPHTVTADNGSFDSGVLRAGQGFEHTFTQPGSFAYYCDVHGGPGGTGMSGTISVQ